jgi:Na+/H+-dicarboxylate symporter
MKLKLHNLIFFGMALGVVVGLGLWWIKKRALDAGQPEPALFTHALWWLDLLGPTIFMGALKMIIAPLILASIVAGVTSLPNVKELGAIGWKTMAYYICTTTIAVVIGLLFVLTIRPGEKGASQKIRQDRVTILEERRDEFRETRRDQPLDAQGHPTAAYLVWLAESEGAAQAGGHEAARYQKLAGARGRTPGDIFKDDLLKPLLMNPFQALTERNSLGIIFFSLLLGIACTVVGGKTAGSCSASPAPSSAERPPAV